MVKSGPNTEMISVLFYNDDLNVECVNNFQSKLPVHMYHYCKNVLVCAQRCIDGLMHSFSESELFVVRDAC